MNYRDRSTLHQYERDAVMILWRHEGFRPTDYIPHKDFWRLYGRIERLKGRMIAAKAQKAHNATPE